MESGFESQINEFLEKFKQSSSRAIEDDFLFDASSEVINNKLDMEYEGIEMTGIK